MATAEIAQLPEVRDVRAILREFVKEFVHDSLADGEIVSAQAVDAAEQAFLRDEEFAVAAVRDAIRAIVPMLIREQVKREPEWLETARGAISGKRLDKTARERFGAMFESVAPGRYKSLLTMRKPELAGVLSERKTRVATELRHIKGLTELHKALPDNDTAVGDLPAQRLQSILRDYFEPGA